jgi:hypothetical protein
MSIEITDKMLDTALDVWDAELASGQRDPELIRECLAAVFALPEVRQAIYNDVRRENEQKLRDMGVTGYSVGWDQ